MTAQETIFAQSSGAGRAAVAVVRLSGPAVSSVIERLAGSLPPPRTFTLRDLRDPVSGDELDRAILVWLPGPRSFTGEDCAELHLHAGPAVLQSVFQVLARQSGVRPAQPGEFTQRAFVNGKMDLVEAEGLADLLDARTARQRRQAFRQMSGQASSVFEDWREQLLLIRADIEAVVDFADEPGVAEEAGPGIDQRIRKLLASMSDAVAQSASAEVIRDGVRVVLAGHPNTGKSSLLNLLARREAAIVSDLPGTTRDVIEVLLDVNGIPVILTDTAGLRERAADKVEEEGMRRTWRHMADADVLIWVWSSDVLGSDDAGSAPVDLVVRNKCDLPARVEKPGLEVSTRSGEGIAALIEGLTALLMDRFGDAESSCLVSARQTFAAEESIRHLNDALAVGSEHLELKSEAIRRASDEIGRLTGRIGVEEWLGAIFSRFCIGK